MQLEQLDLEVKQAHHYQAPSVNQESLDQLDRVDQLDLLDNVVQQESKVKRVI